MVSLASGLVVLQALGQDAEMYGEFCIKDFSKCFLYWYVKVVDIQRFSMMLLQGLKHLDVIKLKPQNNLHCHVQVWSLQLLYVYKETSRVYNYSVVKLLI